MRLLALPLLLILVFPTARGQDAADFFPFASGNEWEYTLTFENWDGSPATYSYIRIVVLRDTLVDGSPGAVYTYTELDAALEPQKETLCYAWPDEDELMVPNSGCYPFDNGFPWIRLGTINYGGEVSVGDSTFPVEARALWNDGYGYGCGTHGARCRIERDHATGLGLYRGERTESNEVYGTRTLTGVLNYARIDGVTFGRRATGNKPPPPAIVEPLALAAYPNPTSGYVYLTASGLRRGRVTIRVYDAAGRQVYDTVLNLFHVTTIHLSTLAKGVYVVRVEDQDGAVASTQIVRK